MTEEKFEQAINMLVASLQETRNALERLAKRQGIEWSLDLKDWVEKEKLDEWRRSAK